MKNKSDKLDLNVLFQENYIKPMNSAFEQFNKSVQDSVEMTKKMFEEKIKFDTELVQKMSSSVVMPESFDISSIQENFLGAMKKAGFPEQMFSAQK